MNIGKIKELEGLKKELSKLQKQSNDNFEQEKTSFFQKNIEEFKDFFMQQNFEIKESSKIDKNGTNNKVVTANYNDFKVDVAIPPTDVSYMGAHSVWELDIYKNKEKYNLMINTARHESASRYINSNSNKELTEDQKIENEIKEVKERINKLEEKLAAGEKTIFVFTLTKEGEKRINCPQFRSMNELLGGLFS